LQERRQRAGAGGRARPRTGEVGAQHQGCPRVKSIAVAMIDYGAGNLGNARRAIEELGFPLKLVSRPADLPVEGPILLPGVGNYGAAMKTIGASGVADAIRSAARGARRLIGICLGLQMLYSTSEEAPGIPGLGVLEGTVRRLNAG